MPSPTARVWWLTRTRAQQTLACKCSHGNQTILTKSAKGKGTLDLVWRKPTASFKGSPTQRSHIGHPNFSVVWSCSCVLARMHQESRCSDLGVSPVLDYLPNRCTVNRSCQFQGPWEALEISSSQMSAAGQPWREAFLWTAASALFSIGIHALFANQ